MDLSEYQRAASATAIYPAEVRTLYPTLGLIGEIGEIANKVKKVYRDDAGVITDDKRYELIGELGDCCWYLAALCSDVGINLNARDLTLPKFMPTLAECVIRLSSSASSIADNVLQSACDPQMGIKLYIQSYVKNMCWLLNAVAYHIGVEFGDVLQLNIDKLMSRKERGTLQGSGDDR